LSRYRAFAEADERESLARRIRNVERRLEEKPVQSEPTPGPSNTGGGHAAGWTLVGTGSALTVTGITLYAVSRVQGTNARDNGDQTSYESARTLNGLSLALGGIGLGATALGAVGIGVGFLNAKPLRGGVHLELNWRF